jgi:hypothetical protein
VSLLGCYILCSESLVELDRLRKKIEVRSDQLVKLEFEVIDSKLRGQSTRVRHEVVWKPSEY